MKSKPILVSACLTGLPCRYDGTDKNRRDLEHLPFCIPLCPEQLAGFSTHREPAEQDAKGRVIRLYSQEDVTAAFHRGAFAVLEYCPGNLVDPTLACIIANIFILFPIKR